MQAFQRMIEIDKIRLNKSLQTISDALLEGGKVYVLSNFSEVCSRYRQEDKCLPG